LASPRVVVVGDVITDLVVRPRHPVAVASDTPSAIDARPGGSGANVASWLAAQGLETHFVGCVGKDLFGAFHADDLRRRGVTPYLAVDPRRSTGTVVALLDGAGERSMLTDRGANLGLRPEHLPVRLFRRGACLHLSGYTLFDEETRAVALAALRLARERGMLVSVDPSSAAPLAAVGSDRFLAWTRGADLCFPNLDEGRLLSGENDPGAVSRALCDWYGGVALTLGAHGALWRRAGDDSVTGPAGPVEVVDSTGAGDAFCAGFLSRWLTGARGEDALAAGLALGAAAVARAGARPELP